MPALDVAVRYVDGRKEVVRVGRPADLIAFADKFGHIAPEPPYAIRELVWLVHRALKIDAPLEAFVDTLEDVSSSDEALAELRVELERELERAGDVAGVVELRDPTPAAAAPVATPLPVSTPTPAPSSEVG